MVLCQARGDMGEIDEVLVVWMPGPNSYTGEDVVELSCHGNPIVVEMLLDELVEAGARLARPGEFTRRALENKRTTMLAAESLETLISATSREGVFLARSAMSGQLDDVAMELRERLLSCCAELEVRLDHPGEELGSESDAILSQTLKAIAAKALSISDTWRAGRVRLEGAVVALIGPVNAGKSSLFNRLVGQQRALVSPKPGTTRDVVERSVLHEGIEVRYLDTAGERDNPVDPIESAGIALGREMSQDTDLDLIVVSLCEPLSKLSQSLISDRVDKSRIVVGTHLDRENRINAVEMLCDAVVSNVTGAGIDNLKGLIQDKIGAGVSTGQSVLVVNQRQHGLFREIGRHASEAAAALDGILGPAVGAEEVTAALERLAELSGEDVRETVLDRMFLRFCIGK